MTGLSPVLSFRHKKEPQKKKSAGALLYKASAVGGQKQHSAGKV